MIDNKSNLNQVNRNQPPSEEDIKETKCLLHDFLIPISDNLDELLNSIQTKAELYNWRKKYIKNHLDSQVNNIQLFKIEKKNKTIFTNQKGEIKWYST